MAEQSSLRMRMRTLGLLPAITYANDTSRKIHVEDRSFDEAKGWIEDADEVDAWSRNATKSVLATSAAQNETQEQAGCGMNYSRLESTLCMLVAS